MGRRMVFDELLAADGAVAVEGGDCLRERSYKNCCGPSRWPSLRKPSLVIRQSAGLLVRLLQSTLSTVKVRTASCTLSIDGVLHCRSSLCAINDDRTLTKAT